MYGISGHHGHELHDRPAILEQDQCRVAPDAAATGACLGVSVAGRTPRAVCLPRPVYPPPRPGRLRSSRVWQLFWFDRHVVAAVTRQMTDTEMRGLRRAPGPRCLRGPGVLTSYSQSAKA